MDKKNILSPADKLRQALERSDYLVVPSCYDALSAKLIEQAGFPACFMSGFAASASRIGAPDLGLMSYGEVVSQVGQISEAVNIALLADGDTGYGNAMNVRRTIKGMARAGAACVLIEDQVAPKRCGHTKGKDVVGFEESCDRIRAAKDEVDAGSDVLIMARTDAIYTHGLSEAIKRAQAYHELGADIMFVEAPASVEDMELICREVPGYRLVNVVEEGTTPVLSKAEYAQIGYHLGVYPLTLMAAAMRAMVQALGHLDEKGPRPDLMSFAQLRQRIGFDDYYETSQKYDSARRG